MIELIFWIVVYGLAASASIILLGKPSLVLGDLSFKTFLLLLMDWRFLVGGLLGMVCRVLFIVINNIASKTPQLSVAHLSITALATTASVLIMLMVNRTLLGEHLSSLQILGAVIITFGIFLTVR